MGPSLEEGKAVGVGVFVGPIICDVGDAISIGVVVGDSEGVALCKRVDINGVGICCDGTGVVETSSGNGERRVGVGIVDVLCKNTLGETEELVKALKLGVTENSTVISGVEPSSVTFGRGIGSESDVFVSSKGPLD